MKKTKRLCARASFVVLLLAIALVGCDNPTQSNTGSGGGGTTPSQPDSQRIMGFWTRQGYPSETLHFTSSTKVFVQMPSIGSGEIDYVLNSSTKRLTFMGTYYAYSGAPGTPFTVVYAYSLTSTQLVLTVVSISPIEFSNIFASQSTFNKSR